MERIRRRYSIGALILTAGFWIFNYAALTIGNWLDALPDAAVRAEARAIAFGVGIVFCFLIQLVIGRFSGRPFWMRILVTCLLACGMGDAVAWAQKLALVTLGDGVAAVSWTAVIFNVAYTIWFSVAWAALYLALLYAKEVREQELARGEMELAAHAAQLQALRYQIRPHFLFNAINSISSLVLTGSGVAADEMLRRLSTFLRATLEVDLQDDTPLADELRLQELYLSIEQARFPELLGEVAVPENLRDALVPTLILQPLVENAVKHSPLKPGEASTILISARREGQSLLLSVENEPGGSGAAGLGLGLRNVAERLERRFGATRHFSAGRNSRGRFEVCLTIPLRMRMR